MVSYARTSMSDSLSLVGCKHASHCMIYSSADETGVSYGLLQIRFDGLIGFAGGEVDVEEVTVDHIVEATNRELEEEINYGFEKVSKDDWICSHQTSDQLFVQHFFAKELSLDQILELERIHMNAEHFPVESLGVFRVPIADSKISEMFLTNFFRQKFAGNARQQFTETLKNRKLLSDEKIKRYEDSATNGTEISFSDNIREVKAMPKIATKILYLKEGVDVTFGLMIIRESGLFDFVGTNFTDVEDQKSKFQIVSKALDRDLGLSQLSIRLNEGSDVLKFDNDLSNVFDFTLSEQDFTQIERNFTSTDNFNKTSFGIFRVPFEFRGQSSKASNYAKRFFNGILKQNFNNNSKCHLKWIYENRFDGQLP